MKHFINKHSAVIEKILTICSLCFILFTMLVPTLSAVITPVSAAEDYSDYLGTWQFDETLDIYSYLTEELEVYTGFSFIANYEGTTFTCEKIMLEAYDSEMQLLTFYLGNSSIIYYDTESGWQFSNIIIVTHCNSELADVLDNFASKVVGKETFDLIFSVDDSRNIYGLQYESGMSFNDWVNSPYNTIGAEVYDLYTYFGQTYKNCIKINTYDQNGHTYATVINLPRGGSPVTSDSLISYSQYDAGQYPIYTPDATEQYELGYKNGWDNGKKAGFNEGKEVGYQEGLNENATGSLGANLLGETLNAPMNALNQFIIYKTASGFPVTLGLVVGGCICLTLFIAFLKIFAGG